MNLITTLEQFSRAVGVSGCESSAAQLATDILSPLGECSTTPLGGVVCKVKTADHTKPHLLLTAHIDQIGMIVTYIDEQGFLRVSSVGGVDAGILPAAQVVVHTESAGAIAGVVCTVPPHLQKDSHSPAPPISDIAIDVGLNKEQCEKIVSLGDHITFAAAPVRLANDRLAGAALDDRAGCVCVIAAAQQLAQENLDCSVTVLLSAMEEVGGQGAGVGTFAIQPTHAIAVDVSFAYREGLTRHKCGILGHGVMIGCAPILQKQMTAALREIAKTKEIPYQMEVMGGKTGTDADNVAIAGAGVCTGLLSIPLHNMHTPAEVVCEKDMQATVDLMVAWTKATFGGDA